MKDLNIWISVSIDEEAESGSEEKLFDERLYLALPPGVAVDDKTREFLVTTTATLIERAMRQMQGLYRPDLEATP